MGLGQIVGDVLDCCLGLQTEEGRDRSGSHVPVEDVTLERPGRESDRRNVGAEINNNIK